MRPPTSEVGAFAYSNAGYVVLGAAVERATGTSWEELMERRLFGPLGMQGCTFGPPAQDRPGPWGHRDRPLPPDDPTADNPVAIGPAGRLSCPLEAWGRFAAAHLAGARGETSLLPPEAWQHLHQPPPGHAYAGGWNVTERDWASGTALTHLGTAGSFFSTAWVAPEEDLALLAVTNAGDPSVLDPVLGVALDRL